MAQPYAKLPILKFAIFSLFWSFGCGGFSAGICTSSYSEVRDYLDLSYTVEPIPGHPAQFALCFNAFQITFQCLRNYHFDPVGLKCTSESIGTDVEDSGAIFVDFEQCEQFYKSLLKCPQGSVYDVLQRRCVPSGELTYESQCSRNADVKPSEQSIDRRLTLSIKGNGTVVDKLEMCSPVGGPCGEPPGIIGCVCDPEVCSKEGSVADWNDCRMFFECQENGFKHHKDCGEGLIFHPGLDPPMCVFDDHEGHVECRDGPKPTTSKPPRPTVPDLSPESTTGTTLVTSTVLTSEPTTPSTEPISEPTTVSTGISSEPTTPSTPTSDPTTPSTVISSEPSTTSTVPSSEFTTTSALSTEPSTPSTISTVISSEPSTISTVISSESSTISTVISSEPSTPSTVISSEPSTISTVISSEPTTTSTAPSTEPTPWTTVPSSESPLTTSTTAPSTQPTQPPIITTKPSVPPPSPITTHIPSTSINPATSAPPTLPPDCRTVPNCTTETPTTPPTEEPEDAYYRSHHNLIFYFLVFFITGIMTMLLILIFLHKRKQTQRRYHKRVQFEAYHY